MAPFFRSNEVIKIEYDDEDEMEYDEDEEVSKTDEPDTTEVIINGKRFHFQVDLDRGSNVECVRLTECGNPNVCEMLETYDLYPDE